MDAKPTMRRKTLVRKGRYHVIVGMADDITDDELQFMQIEALTAIDTLRQNPLGYADGEPWRLFRESQAAHLGIDLADAGDGKPDFIEPDLQ
jgi:hypothetical protein